MRIFSLLFFVFLFSCTQDKKVFLFEDVSCNPEATPEFDGRKVTLIDNKTGERRDTILEKIAKRRNVFKPCRKYIYLATYKDSDSKIISKSRVWMMATGKRWEFDNHIQDEIIIQYEIDSTQFPDIREKAVNKSLEFFPLKKDITGIIENDQQVWMHPFRVNQYNFTEVAPFPKVELPLEKDKFWTASLSIGQGWGDWENTSIHSEYRVLQKENLRTLYSDVKDCWKIHSTASADFGNSENLFWFNRELGFVKMNYKNYKGQTLDFELEQVID